MYWEVRSSFEHLNADIEISSVLVFRMVMPTRRLIRLMKSTACKTARPREEGLKRKQLRS